MPKHTEPEPAQLHISWYKVSPLVVYLVMELQSDKAAAAGRFYYSVWIMWDWYKHCPLQGPSIGQKGAPAEEGQLVPHKL